MNAAKIDVAVLILFFNRPDHLKEVFEAVRQARPARLFLYQDGPRDEKDLPGIEECRRIVEDIDWECDVHRWYQEENQGCDPSEYLSQKWAFSMTDKCIVLEDDDVPSQSFFLFCKEMLDRYENDPRIWMIAGFNAEEKTEDATSDYFFTSVFSIWGWASWKRVIDTWDEKYRWLDDEQTVKRLEAMVKKRQLRKDFLPMCRDHRDSGIAYYETIFWASMLLNDGLAIMPALNMVNNLGVSAESTHFTANLNTIPSRLRKMFTMPRYDIDFPLTPPPRVVENTAYKTRIYKINAWGYPLIKVRYSLEELWNNLRQGNFMLIGKAIANRISKMTGRKKYR